MHQRIALSLLLLSGAIAGCSQGNAQPQTADEPATGPEVEAAVKAANEEFYVALNEMFKGDATPMEDIWSHEDDATYLPPWLERISGWDDIQASFEKQAELKLEGMIEGQDVVVHLLTPELALVVTSEVGENPNLPGDGETAVSIRSTKLFRLDDGSWKLFYDHADLIFGLAVEAPES